MALPVNTLLLFFVSLLLGSASSERCQHVKELPVPAAECGRRIDAPRAVGAILRLKNVLVLSVYAHLIFAPLGGAAPPNLMSNR